MVTLPEMRSNKTQWKPSDRCKKSVGWPWNTKNAQWSSLWERGIIDVMVFGIEVNCTFLTVSLNLSLPKLSLIICYRAIHERG